MRYPSACDPAGTPVVAGKAWHACDVISVEVTEVGTLRHTIA